MLRPRNFVRRAQADQGGAAAVEFAFVAPLMILLFFGLAQLSQAIIASRHANHSASTLGDLVAQCSSINDSDLSNILNAGRDVMTPLPSGLTQMSERVTSVAVVDNSGTTQAQWTQESGNPDGTTKYTVGQTVTLPPNVLSTTKGDSVILSESVYRYTFPFTAGGLLPIGSSSVSLSFGQAINFDLKTYFKPRRSSVVTYTGSDPSGQSPGGSSQGTSCYAS